jgi:hypothetical protein
MKRYGNLYEKVCDIENLRVALHNASKTKKHIRSVKRVLEDEEKYLHDLRNLLLNEQFVNGKYHVFLLTERGKERTIHSLPFYPDRIVHHAIVQVCAQFWIKSFIRDTYASIPGRGIHDGVRRIQKIIPNCEGYYALKCDITKFYPSVDHEILKQILRKQIKDPKLLRLLDIIVDSGPGVPIGNYLSQYFGNLILNPLDHWLKQDKRIKYYFRYCDDFVILHKSKKVLHSLLTKIKEKLSDYNLKVKHNWQIFPVNDRGVDFLGYRFWPNKTLLRKTSLRSFLRRIKVKRMTLNEALRLRDATGAYKGWLKYCDNRGLKRKHVLPLKARYNRYLRRLRRRLLKA